MLIASDAYPSSDVSSASVVLVAGEFTIAASAGSNSVVMSRASVDVWCVPIVEDEVAAESCSWASADAGDVFVVVDEAAGSKSQSWAFADAVEASVVEKVVTCSGSQSGASADVTHAGLGPNIVISQREETTLTVEANARNGKERKKEKEIDTHLSITYQSLTCGNQHNKCSARSVERWRCEAPRYQSVGTARSISFITTAGFCGDPSGTPSISKLPIDGILSARPCQWP